MAQPPVAYLLNPKQQQAVVNYVINCVTSLAQVWNLRQQFLNRDLAYYRELDRSVEQTKALSANWAGDPYKFQNLQIPVVMPQVESALAYQAGVFLTGYPIFGIATNDAQKADAALQLETIIGDNSVTYGWIRQLILFMRDCLKYNLGAIEVTWKRKRVYSLVNDAASAARGQPTKNTELVYEGNSLRRLDPYNLIWDKRVNPTQVHTDGEFVGYTEIFSRIQLKQLLLDLNSEFTMNAREAFETGSPSITLNGSDSWYYVPQINPNSFIGYQFYPTTNWLSWAMIDTDGTGQGKKGIEYNNMYEITTIYGRVIPEDFRLVVPRRNQPQIWKFIIVNRRVCIYAERQTNAHNMLPIILGAPTEDGLGYQTKSFLDNSIPFQFMSTALWNAAIESKRRQVFDRIFYDPSRIRKEDIDKVTSVARIPVKQSAYGKPISEAVWSNSYHDENISGVFQMAQMVYEMADVTNGQNKVDRGQFQKGNKTKTEFQQTMGNSNARQQLQALMLEYQVFTPMKEMIKLNMLQYQPPATLFNRDTNTAVTIKPEELRDAALVFKVSDGLTPTDKLISTDLLQVFMQTVQASPIMMAQYDIVGAFAYWCKMQGAQWFTNFQRNPADAAKVMQQLTAMEQAKKQPPQQQQQPAQAQ